MKTVSQLIISVQSDNSAVWAQNVEKGLRELGYTAHADNVLDWLKQGPGKSTSGIAYKNRHNKGVFPPEQVFCNQKTKARRPLRQVASAVELAIKNNVLYNPDRFETLPSEMGVRQGLAQFGRKEEYTDKKEIMNALQGKEVSGKKAKEIAKLAEGLKTSDKNLYIEMANKLADSLGKLKARPVPEFKIETLENEI